MRGTGAGTCSPRIRQPQPLLPKHRSYFKGQFATSYHDDNVSPISFAWGLRALKTLGDVIGFFSVGSALSGVSCALNEKEQQDKPLPLLPLPGKKKKSQFFWLLPARKGFK